MTDLGTMQEIELTFSGFGYEAFSIDLDLIGTVYQGPPGSQGDPGQNGEDGREVELAVIGENICWRYSGTLEWTVLVPLEDLEGDPGTPGLNGQDGQNGESAYQVWLNQGNIGTEADFIASLKGEPGEPGEQGSPGADGQDGEDGREVELIQQDGWVQWRYVGDTTWTNLIAVTDLKGEKGDQGNPGLAGADGKSVELQTNGTHIQWRLVGDTAWIDLVALADIQGPQDPKGDPGEFEEAPEDGNLYGRKNGGWEEIVNGGGGDGVEEAPIDGVSYVRKNGAWEPESEGGSVAERRSARYWRIRAIGLNPANTGGNPTVGFAGVDFRDSTGASLVSGGTAIASSFTSGYPASNAFDSNVATSWYSVSNRNNGEWIGYDFGRSVTPYSIALTPNYGFPQGSPRSFALESSSDGTTWALHSVYYADSEWTGSTVKTFSVPLLNTRVATGIAYRVGFFVLAALAASEVAAMHVFTDAVTFPAKFAGSRASVGVNPAATFVLSVQKNGTEIGTISISTAGVVTFATSGAAAVAFAAGDVLRVVGPVTVGTAANFAVTLLAEIN